MEKLRRLINQIAYTAPSQRLSTLSPLQLSLIPFLSFASTLYGLAISARHHLYHLGLLQKKRLPIPVISIGNLTWGGNGKTPMVEFVALWLCKAGISPLILTRGYGGADEVKMLQRHLQGTSVKIGVGANRAATAFKFLGIYSYLNQRAVMRSHSQSDHIGCAVLDDGMQHLALWRDLEIVMINGMMPWGNNELIPLGPLRELLTGLHRADIVVIHHADLVEEQDVEAILSKIRNVKQSLSIFFSRMVPLHFLDVGNLFCPLHLRIVYNSIVMCISGIGSADSFIQRIKEMKPAYVDRLDFSDHYMFQPKDIHMIIERLQKLEARFLAKPIIVITEKDYDRAPDILKTLHPYRVLVLCSQLEILPISGTTEYDFKMCLKQHLESILCGTNMK